VLEIRAMLLSLVPYVDPESGEGEELKSLLDSIERSLPLLDYERPDAPPDEPENAA
jgi:hypothetical protein